MYMNVNVCVCVCVCVCVQMMQKLGKSDQTRDDVFEEFVNNFNKQNVRQNNSVSLPPFMCCYIFFSGMRLQITEGDDEIHEQH